MNSDKVLILDNGNLVEFDTVKNLLENKKSLFYDFYKKSL
jgi:ABC-type multidrug transport system fused ATPase/permease subunit